jgi:hypothetical protein
LKPKHFSSPSFFRESFADSLVIPIEEIVARTNDGRLNYAKTKSRHTHGE